MPYGVTTTRQASEINLAVLADAAQAAAGQPLSIIMHVEADGTATFDVLAPDGTDTTGITPTQIRNFVTNHVKPPPPVSPWTTLVDALTAATTLAEAKQALIAWATAMKPRNLPR